MANSAQDSQTIEEIRQMLLESQKGRREKERGAVHHTPYGKYVENVESKAKVRRKAGETTLHMRKSRSGHDLKTKSSNTFSMIETDALLRKYVDELSDQKVDKLDPVDFKIKTLTVTHVDTTTKINTFFEGDASYLSRNPLKLVESKPPNRATNPLSSSAGSLPTKRAQRAERRRSSSQSTASPHKKKPTKGPSKTVEASISEVVPIARRDKLKYVSANKFKKKYSRFCQGLEFTDADLQSIGSKGDSWIVKFMEICYDDALQALQSAPSSSRPSSLPLGGLDAFPLLVQRNVNKIYSMMDIRKTTCLELLYTVELVMEKTDRLRFAGPATGDEQTNHTVCDSGRTALFSKFLSEEYDAEVLMLFLYCRNHVETLLGRKLRFINPTRVWAGCATQPAGVDVNAATGDVSLDAFTSFPEARKKVVPYALPTKWRFLDDVALPETPLVAFDAALQLHLLYLMFGKLDGVVRDFLVDRVLQVLAKDRPSHKGRGMDSLALSESRTLYSITATASRDMSTDSITTSLAEVAAVYIPVYTILRALCMEYKKLSSEEKANFTNSGTTMASLLTLNDLYADNNALAKQHEARIHELEAKLVQATAAIAQLEKAIKRTTKVWQNKLQLLGGENVHDKLDTLKAEMLDAQALRDEVEVQLRHAKRVFSDHAARAAHLWQQATLPTHSFGAVTKADNVKGWQGYIQHMSVKAWEFNYKQDLLIKDVRQQPKQPNRVPTPKINNFLSPASSPFPSGGQDPLGQEQLQPGQVRDGSKEVRFLVLETLGRLCVRSAIKTALHRTQMHRLVAFEKHHLLLKYGDEAYRQAEEDRRRREEEERRRQHRLKIQKVVARGLAHQLVTFTLVPDGQLVAFKALYDTFHYLDLPLDQYINARKLHVAERMFRLAKQKRDKHVLWRVFRRLREPFNATVTRRKLHGRLQERTWLTWRAHFRLHVHGVRALQRIQHALRAGVYRRRLQRHLLHQSACLAQARSHLAARLTDQRREMLRFWRQYAHLRHSYGLCVGAIGERNFLKSFYTWLHVFRLSVRRKRYQSELQIRMTINIQRVARGFIARRRTRVIKSKWTIYNAVCNFRARSILSQRLRRRRLHVEFTAHLWHQARHYATRRAFQTHKRIYGVHHGTNLAQRVVDRHRQSCGYQRWLAFYIALVGDRRRSAILIQSVVRMFVVYWRIHRWKKSLVLLQATVRGFVTLCKFRRHLFYHRRAILLQKHVRRFQVVRYVTRLRARQVFKDAAENNYAKIKFYLDHYRDLLLEVDEEGNSLMHVAAKFASKRVLKLLIKERLFEDINAYNPAGLTPMHMLITSPVDPATRDEVFFYFIERGFDEDIPTQYEERSCLLLACLFSATGIATGLIDDGHDVNTEDRDGLTPVQAACFTGNHVLVKHLVDHGAEAHRLGFAQRYPIHDAVLGGNLEVLYVLLQQPDVDLGAREAVNQQTPLMFSCIYAQAEYARALLHYHYKAPKEDHLKQRFNRSSSSISLGSKTGSHDVQLLGQDSQGRYAVHHAAMGPDPAILDLLRGADMDFECVDAQGNTPLHLAVFAQSYSNAKYLLEAGVYPSPQNEDGDQPLHLACRSDDTVSLLSLLSQYDQEMGRLNYAHQSPWAVAQMYQALACLAFLQENFSRLDHTLAKSAVLQQSMDQDALGFTRPWDAELDPGMHMYSTADGVRVFVDPVTGQQSLAPPTIASSHLITEKAKQGVKLPVQATVRMVTDQDLALYDNKYTPVADDVYASDNIVLAKFNYKDAFEEQKEEIKTLSVHFYNASIITKWARRKLAYNRVRRIRQVNKAKRNLLIFIRRHLPGFMAWKQLLYYTSARRIQARMRGVLLRRFFFRSEHIVNYYFEVYSVRPYDTIPQNALKPYFLLEGQYFALRHKFFQRRLFRILRRVYKRYKTTSDYRVFQRVLRVLPTMTLKDWGEVIAEAKWPNRVVGFYEEYTYPGSRHMLFYRHTMTGQCSFQKPKKLIYLDDTEQREALETAKYGGTLRQIALVTKMQALWRGYAIKNYFHKVEKSIEISRRAEDLYLAHPERDVNLYNYALYLLTFSQEIPRCRTVFTECLRRMQYHGPDVAFVLYSYIIYAMVSHDENFEDILELRERAWEAERRQLQALRDKEAKKAKTLDAELDTRPRSASKADKLRSQVQEARQNEASPALAPVDKASAIIRRPDTVEEAMERQRNTSAGRIYDLAHVGFFRFNATVHNNSLGHELLALCRFLVYDDFSGSFRHFMDAFHHAPENAQLMENFNLMMTYYFGKNAAKKDAVVKQKMQALAQQDADQEEVRRAIRDRAQRRYVAAKAIQKWYRECRARRLFASFMTAVSDQVSVARSMQQSVARTRGQSRRPSSRSRSQSQSRSQSPSKTRARGATPQPGSRAESRASSRRDITTPGSSGYGSLS